MTLKIKFIQFPQLEFFEKKSSCLINILLLILFYIIGSTILSAIGSKNGRLLNADKNISICETNLSRFKKPNKTGLRICIALCIHTGRVFYAINNNYNSTQHNPFNHKQLHYKNLNYFKNTKNHGYILLPRRLLLNALKLVMIHHRLISHR